MHAPVRRKLHLKRRVDVQKRVGAYHDIHVKVQHVHASAKDASHRGHLARKLFSCCLPPCTTTVARRASRCR